MIVIVWLASFPRSGNTYLRIVLNRLYGVRTSVVYDIDGVASRLGEALVGYQDRPASYAAMRQSDVVYFIKTHRKRDARVEEADQAVCLVRDGRDALVSWARQRSENDPGSYRSTLRDMIDASAATSTGSWGGNILSWLQPSSTLVRFEALVADPHAIAAQIIDEVAPRPMQCDAQLPSFRELQRVDPLFFRRGTTASYREELPDDLESLFWAQPDNREAMARLGYG